MKGTFRKINALVTPRKILVVLQFSFAITLIVCTMIVWQQIKYAQQREAGYDKGNLVYVFLTGDISKNISLIKNDLIRKGIATSISKTSAPLTEGWSSGGGDWAGKDPNDRTEINFFNSDGNLVKTAGLQLTEGRDLDLQKYPTDSTGVILFKERHTIINQSLEELITFRKNAKTYDLVVDSKIITLHFNIFKKPLGILYDNKVPIGEASTTSRFSLGEPDILVKFSANKKINFYALIYLIIRLQPGIA